jgi:predicted ATP-binding protein involved in virulence
MFVQKNLNIVTGQNGSGKSTVLVALSVCCKYVCVVGVRIRCITHTWEYAYVCIMCIYSCNHICIQNLEVSMGLCVSLYVCAYVRYVRYVT